MRCSLKTNDGISEETSATFTSRRSSTSACSPVSEGRTRSWKRSTAWRDSSILTRRAYEARPTCKPSLRQVSYSPAISSNRDRRRS